MTKQQTYLLGIATFCLSLVLSRYLPMIFNPAAGKNSQLYCAIAWAPALAWYITMTIAHSRWRFLLDDGGEMSPLIGLVVFAFIMAAGGSIWQSLWESSLHQTINPQLVLSLPHWWTQTLPTAPGLSVISALFMAIIVSGNLQLEIAVYKESHQSTETCNTLVTL